MPPTRCRRRPCCAVWDCRGVSAGCRWVRRRRLSTSGRPTCWPLCAPRSGRVVRRESPLAEPVRITFLGGLGEIGRNCACIELEGRIVLLDCGLMFPNLEMPGVDLVLPDFTYLRENADRVEACILTHGHEDHT